MKVPVVGASGEKVYGCPWELIPDTVFELADMFGHYQNHYLPFEGGLDNQPAYVSEAIALFSRAENERQENEAAMQKRKGERSLKVRGG